MTDEERIISVIDIARRATTTVKLLPFVYVLAYIVCAVAFFFVSDETQTVLDMLFYVSPLQIAFLLILSKVFKLCKWHKLECSLPLLSQVFVVIDTFHPLDEWGAKINVAVIGAMCALSFVNAYFMFWRKTPPQRN